MKKLIKRFVCWFRGHDWTCAAQQGIPPTRQQMDKIDGYKDYAKMYCARCGKESKLNNLL